MRNYDHYLKAGVLSNCIAATNQVHYLKKDENVWQKRHMALIYLYCHHLDPRKMLFCDSFTMTKVVDAGSYMMPDSFHCHPYIEKVTGRICFKSDISIMPDRFMKLSSLHRKINMAYMFQIRFFVSMLSRMHM